MGELAVLAERFAVVGGHHHQGRRLAAIEERPQQRREKGVGRGDLAVVEIAGEARGERLGRGVGSVRIEEVDPEEARPPLLPAPPGEGGADHLVAAPFGAGEPFGLRAAAGAVVVDLEAVAQAELRIEGEAADEGARGIARGVEDRGEGRHRARQPKAAVVAHAVLVRIEAGQDVGVGGQRRDVVRVSVGKDPAGRGEAVEDRGLGLAVAGESQRVGPQGVNGDEDDVGARRLRGFRRFRRLSREGGEPPGGQQEQCPESAGGQAVGNLHSFGILRSPGEGAPGDIRASVG